MSTRFTSLKPLTRCLNPISVYRDGVYMQFPCGRCEACLLDRANDWSMRLRDEIEATPFTIFFTLTYSNKYLPHMSLSVDAMGQCFYRPAADNIRFDGVRDVRRIDDFTLCFKRCDLPIKHFSDIDCVGYSSKRDIQLWLKLLRKDINLHFNNLDSDGKEISHEYRFRYYIISEYGPTTFRPHYHGLLFFTSCEAATYALQVALYQNWQMCDERLFKEHTHFCDSGAAEYVTNYVTGNSRLPKILKSEEIRPFRLASKSPSIGFVSFDPKEIFESLFSGTCEYHKRVDRIGNEYIFPYPASYCRRLFPKCREYRLVSYQRLRYIYGFILKNVTERGFSFDRVCNFIRPKWFVADYTASLKTYYICTRYGFNLDTYLYLLDMYYYKEQMCALKKFYEWQEQQNDINKIIFSYSNFSDLCHRYRTSSSWNRYFFEVWLSNFGIDAFIYCNSLKDSDLIYRDSEKDLFRKDVSDILENAIKLPKFNELAGTAPHII